MENQLGRENKGITLVALVITIIVLLILAGITINLVLGDNGILERAKNAGKNYIDAAKSEENMLQETGDLIQIEEGTANASKTKGYYEIKAINGQNVSLLITIENEKGIESVEYPDTAEDKIVFTDNRASTTKDITLEENQEYEVKIKAIGEKEEIYKIIPSTKPQIQVTNTQIKEEEKDGKVIQRVVKTVEIQYTANSKMENYYSLDNGVTWKKYTGAIEIKDKTIVMAKSRIKQGNEIVKPEEILEIKPEKICTQIIVTGYGTSGNTYAIDSEGNLWAWGSENYYGQLTGNGTTTAQSVKKVLSPNRIAHDVKTVEADQSTVHFADKNGQLWGWGSNNFGRIGDNTKDNRTTMIAIPTEVGIVQIEKENDFSNSAITFLIDREGGLWSTGYDSGYGTLGIGNHSTKKFVQIASETKFKTLITTQEANSFGTAYAIDEKGGLWGWGKNSSGELGIGDKSKRTVPVKIQEGAKFTSGIISERNFSCYRQ